MIIHKDFIIRPNLSSVKVSNFIFRVSLVCVSTFLFVLKQKGRTFVRVSGQQVNTTHVGLSQPYKNRRSFVLRFEFYRVFYCCFFLHLWEVLQYLLGLVNRHHGSGRGTENRGHNKEISGFYRRYRSVFLIYEFFFKKILCKKRRKYIEEFLFFLKDFGRFY